MAQVVISRNLTPYLEMIYPNASHQVKHTAPWFFENMNFNYVHKNVCHKQHAIKLNYFISKSSEIPFPVA